MLPKKQVSTKPTEAQSRHWKDMGLGNSTPIDKHTHQDNPKPLPSHQQKTEHATAPAVATARTTNHPQTRKTKKQQTTTKPERQKAHNSKDPNRKPGHPQESKHKTQIPKHQPPPPLPPPEPPPAGNTQLPRKKTGKEPIQDTKNPKGRSRSTPQNTGKTKQKITPTTKAVKIQKEAININSLKDRSRPKPAPKEEKKENTTPTNGSIPQND
jgi:hypothetical protein